MTFEVLHKSAIVLLVACWEAFIEDLAAATLSWMILHSKSHSTFPPVVHSIVSHRSTTEARLGIWPETGGELLSRTTSKSCWLVTTGALNTPRAKQLDELLEKTVGLRALSSSWSWKGRSAAQARDALDDLISLRGSIAHRVTSARHVRLKDVSDARHFVCRLAVKSHNAVCAYLVGVHGSSPWNRLVYRKTK